MPSFDTAVARVLTEGEEVAPVEYPFDFDIVERDPETDDVIDTVKCYAREPGEGEIIILMTDVLGRRADDSHKLAGIIDFLTDVLDETSRHYVVGRLLDIRDPFGLADLMPILDWMVETWSGRPTRQPSDYLPSRKTGGRNSTRPTSKSTSSGSRSTASSTRPTPTSSSR